MTEREAPSRAERRRSERAARKAPLRTEPPRLAPSVQQLATGRQARTVGLVMAATMVLWVLGNLAGRALGLPGRYALLIDFAALAAFIWGLVATWRIWQKRRDG